MATSNPGYGALRRSMMVMALVSGSLLAACATNQQSMAEFVDDAAITTRVKNRLAADRVLGTRLIAIDTLAANVRLSGEVGTRAERLRAEELARQADGVKGVRNELVVKP